ncbi:ceramidase domain-containing protein [Foetidibacter luteolus]|uniref:ceramidase domain-containing protein n=1 Tax=Foetidibacter luteolus TaxID=2608880 RepID=UPI00129AF5B2|nr:ceramidase domain-containing protein [Foetidibacter luteolus]
MHDKTCFRTKQNKTLLLLLLSLVSIAIIPFLPKVGQALSFHHFSDARTILHVPNFMNVASNFPFLLVGILGLVNTWRQSNAAGAKLLYTALFTGICLTAVGSGYYHFQPGNNTLVYDRIPMTVVFMAFFCVTIARLVSKTVGVLLLAPLVIAGVASVVYWHVTELRHQGDLRWYGWVQFYPVVFIPLVMLLFRTRSSPHQFRLLGYAILWYLLAKVLEHYDQAIYHATKQISGHTLKHLAAGMATVCIYRLLFPKKMQDFGSGQVV